MPTAKTTAWDSAEHLNTPEDIAAYLEAAFEDGEPALINHALGVVARCKGMTELAQRTGMGRQSLYKALSVDGRPEFTQRSPQLRFALARRRYLRERHDRRRENHDDRGHDEQLDERVPVRVVPSPIA